MTTYYLLQFSDNSLDVLKEDKLIFGEEIKRGDTVQAFYQEKKKSQLYQAKVLKMSGKFFYYIGYIFVIQCY